MSKYYYVNNAGIVSWCKMENGVGVEISNTPEAYAGIPESDLLAAINEELEHKKTIEYLKEHPNVDTNAAASMVALDHLSEDPTYYSAQGAAKKLVGASHEEGGIPAVTPNGVPVELEHEEVIVSADVFKDDTVYNVVGTPKQIIGALLKENGGDELVGGALLSKIAAPKMKDGGQIYDKYSLKTKIIIDAVADKEIDESKLNKASKAAYDKFLESWDSMWFSDVVDMIVLYPTAKYPKGYDALDPDIKAIYPKMPDDVLAHFEDLESNRASTDEYTYFKSLRDYPYWYEEGQDDYQIEEHLNPDAEKLYDVIISESPSALVTKEEKEQNLEFNFNGASQKKKKSPTLAKPKTTKKMATSKSKKTSTPAKKTVKKRKTAQAKRNAKGKLTKEAAASVVRKKKKRSERSIAADRKKKALHPGKRISKNGKVYYESRPNRSDVDRRKKI